MPLRASPFGLFCLDSQCSGSSGNCGVLTNQEEGTVCVHCVCSGHLIIAEVSSRMASLSAFVAAVESLGFRKTKQVGCLRRFPQSGASLVFSCQRLFEVQ